MIRTMFTFATSVMVVIALAALPGCGGSRSPAKKTPAKTGHYEGDGHDHSKDKDDHSGHDHEKEGKTK